MPGSSTGLTTLSSTMMVSDPKGSSRHEWFTGGGPWIFLHQTAGGPGGYSGYTPLGILLYGEGVPVAGGQVRWEQRGGEGEIFYSNIFFTSHFTKY